MFRRILIANRGEIACRIIRTARRMGIVAVAVYSDADRGARHVAEADAAYRIGPPPARESYLDIGAILHAARASGAEAIHPGYGFLSENAAFAEACAAAGIVFIGPGAAAIRAMGSKSAAKTLMERAGVPLVPGYHGADQDAATLSRAAAAIGYPVLIKASAGGGGKGMRIVERAEDFAPALEGAQREALASFGDGTVLVEKYLIRPRHIESQVFADSHGTTLALYERDCSIQRRHQKIIEEAPAPGIGEAERAAIATAAIAAARAVEYVGAGTVEFIHADGRFYFMEMNTRLQVEHPVTEMITGLDLVEWQLRVAAGERLPAVPPCRGHAIEARIYAEDPARGFLPAIGRIHHLREPAASAQVRVDSGVRAGDAIRVEYDPMIAKLIVHGEDRAEAIRRLAAALGAFEVAGVATNLALLRAIAGHAEFAAAAPDTGFIDRHPDLLAAAPPPPAAAIAAAVLALLHQNEAAARAAAGDDPHSPWAACDGFSPVLALPLSFTLRAGDASHALVATAAGPGAWRLAIDGAEHLLAGTVDGAAIRLDLDGAIHPGAFAREGEALSVFLDGAAHAFHLVDPYRPPGGEEAVGGRVIAPIPGTVARLLAEPGARVGHGAALVVLEAMKMELTLTAPADGTVEAVHVAVGEMVAEGQELLAFVADA